MKNFSLLNWNTSSSCLDQFKEPLQFRCLPVIQPDCKPSTETIYWRALKQTGSVGFGHKVSFHDKDQLPAVCFLLHLPFRHLLQASWLMISTLVFVYVGVKISENVMIWWTIVMLPEVVDKSVHRGIKCLPCLRQVVYGEKMVTKRSDQCTCDCMKWHGVSRKKQRVRKVSKPNISTFWNRDVKGLQFRCWRQIDARFSKLYDNSYKETAKICFKYRLTA